MNYAIKKRYVPASQRFDERPKLKSMRRDEFTLEEYRKPRANRGEISAARPKKIRDILSKAKDLRIAYYLHA